MRQETGCPTARGTENLQSSALLLWVGRQCESGHGWAQYEVAEKSGDVEGLPRRCSSRRDPCVDLSSFVSRQSRALSDAYPICGNPLTLQSWPEDSSL